MSAEPPKGLIVYIDAFDHTSILSFLQKQNFEPITEFPNSRKVLQYGRGYNYLRGSNRIEVKPIPEEIESLAEEFFVKIGVKIPYDSVIVNRYVSDQGITSHVDSKEFAGHILCFVVGDGAMIDFVHKEKGKYSVYLKGGDVYIMTGESRYEWTHGIAKRKNDVVDGLKVSRGTRYSVTLRNSL